jgi:hypothetical protein
MMPGKVNIYITGTDLSLAAGVELQISLNGKLAGSIAPNTFFLLEVEPGTHQVAVTTPWGRRTAIIDANPGENNFLRIVTRVAFPQSRLEIQMQAMAQGEGMKAVQDAKRAEVLLRQATFPEGMAPQAVRGEIVQANMLLFRQGTSLAHPALIVFSLSSKMAVNDLKQLARLAFSLKGSRPTDPDRALLARAVTDESYIPNHFVKIPSSVTGNDETYLAHVWIARSKLTEGYLRSNTSLEFHVYLADGKPYTGNGHRRSIASLSLCGPDGLQA